MLARCDLVLVGTQNPENLGGVARLADNFALASLTMVAPRAQPRDPRALVVGRMARARLEGARVVGTLDEAVGAASVVVGFSARRGGDRPMTSLRALPSEMAAHGGRVALVFGPEDNGLDSAAIARCDLVVAIELPGSLPSLNLTQAVAIVLWELARPHDAPPPPSRAQATHAELDALVDHAASAGLVDGERERTHLRRLLAAAALDPADVRALHGLVAKARAT
jgi:tRNA/rRNA methyltransferase